MCGVHVWHVRVFRQAEMEALRTLVFDYASYIRRNPNTLLTKFLGCYCIHMYGKQIFFTVMTNMLFSSDRAVHDTYDLKGSTVHRSATKPKTGALAFCKHCKHNYRVGKRNERCPARLRHPHVARQTLKDNDLKFKIRLGPKRAAIIDQIRRDAEFLRDHGIMDYSLLLGVHRAKFRIQSGAGGVSCVARAAAAAAAAWQPVL